MGFAKTIIGWLFIVLVVVTFWNFYSATKNAKNENIDYSQFQTKIKNKQIKSAIFKGNTIEGEYSGSKLENIDKFSVIIPKGSEEKIADLLNEQGVSVEIRSEKTSGLFQFLFSWFPVLLFIGFWIFIMRQVQGGSGKAMAFGKSKHKQSNSQRRVTFQDVAGIEEAKEELQEIVEFLKEPGKFQKLGGKIPKGVLLMGPTGTGKTLLARAVAGEANVPFFSISGSDFVEMFVGVGASRVRDLFQQGKKNAPCILFIDEIDAVGRHRGAGVGGGHDEREQTLNQLLVEMDGFEGREGVILIAATNRPDVLDPALLRPGRFDRQVVVNLPDLNGRDKILKIHSRKVPLEENLDLSVIARGTPGLSGADLANLVNEAALNAAKFDRKSVTKEDFDEAKDKVLMGKERRSLVISEKDKKITAYHEAGHALIAYLSPEADPLHKVTIIPRGRSLGSTMKLPEVDKYNYTDKYLETEITILLAGRCAEQIFLNTCTTGASNDIERATELARKMVCEVGMSNLGPIAFGRVERQIFLGKEFNQQQNFSEDTAMKIDAEVTRIITEGQNRAKEILTQNKEKLQRLAEALLEKETLDLEEIKLVLDN